MLYSSKLKTYADDNFKVDENGRKFPKRVENTGGKEKLLVTSNFSFSHNVFKKVELQTCKTQGLFGKGLTTLQEKPFEKGENTGKQHFFLFPQCFPFFQKMSLIVLDLFQLPSANAFSLVNYSKFLSFVQEIRD